MELTEKEAKLKLRLAQIEKNEKCQQDFLIFVKNMWPDFIAGRHHKIIAEKLDIPCINFSDLVDCSIENKYKSNICASAVSIAQLNRISQIK